MSAYRKTNPLVDFHHGRVFVCRRHRCYFQNGFADASLLNDATAAAITVLMRASSWPVRTLAANARRARSWAFVLGAGSVAISAVKCSCTLMSLRSPRQSRTSPSAERNAVLCAALTPSCRRAPFRRIGPHSEAFWPVCEACVACVDLISSAAGQRHFDLRSPDLERVGRSAHSGLEYRPQRWPVRRTRNVTPFFRSANLSVSK